VEAVKQQRLSGDQRLLRTGAVRAQAGTNRRRPMRRGENSDSKSEQCPELHSLWALAGKGVL